ncbi:GNAT family N-acetyltransferase [Streptomyces candidus]|uniref:Lysine N-acyltransferase MbtK n=1 Tax=Streptomyces candidus TaxID=67283 RepID=A0A7X0HDE0_9ACTN|nr:GNAT family N-acetyltransferase [Streptomyces candidus]MBB6434227.1 RimJ/RimL family protein N-acetyltransferase [Streptomyces candidus]GHH37486.1 N-acetyltransferase [Streptomyces candidus]
MPPTDANTAPGADTGVATAPFAPSDNEETLELRLPDEFVALFGGGSGAATGTADGTGTGEGTGSGTGNGTAEKDRPRPTWENAPAGADLLDFVAHWPPAPTPAGTFRLVPVRPEHDLPLVSGWMNDPAVAAFWELAGPEEITAAHLRGQLDGDGRSVPCLGVLDGTAMSYWEIYRADLDPLARHYPARPHDTGIHLLIGSAADRGRGLGTLLLRAVCDLVLDHRPSCARVVAEPDLRNTPSVSAFLRAGFRLCAEVDLPGKRAALMMRDRVHRPRAA